MRFELSETQKQIEKNARQFLGNECPIGEVRRLMETVTAFDAALWSKMAAQGWTGLIVPEMYDGMGMGLVEMAVTFEQMGKALLPGPFLSTTIAGGLINAAASEQQKGRYLPPICAGDTRASVAIIEDDADWDTTAWSSTYASGRLTGQKLYVMDAAEAAFLIVAATADGLPCLVLVPAGDARVVPMAAMDLTRKMYAVTFDRARGELLARGRAAEVALDHGLEIANLALCAEMVGGMQRVLELSVAYAKTRRQFDQPIGKFQAVQHMCADMLLWTEGSRSAVYYAAWALEKGLPEAKSAVSVAKIYSGDAYREIGNRGIQIHGGMGFTWENDLHLYYRRAKVSETAFGDARYHRERIARLVIDNEFPDRLSLARTPPEREWLAPAGD